VQAYAPWANASCEYLRVTNKSLPFTTQYFINSVKIQQVLHAKYLGVYIDETLSWNYHVDHVCNKANVVRSFLQHNFETMSIKSKGKMLFNVSTTAMLEYACVQCLVTLSLHLTIFIN